MFVIPETKKRKLNRTGDFEEIIYSQFIHPSKKSRKEINDEDDDGTYEINNDISMQLTEEDTNEEIYKKMSELKIYTDTEYCNTNDFNNFFTDELENEIIKNTLCLGDDKLYKNFTEYTRNYKDNIYFNYGDKQNHNDNVQTCNNIILSRIEKIKTEQLKYKDKIIDIDFCEIKTGELYHGSINYFTEILNKEMWLSFTEKQSILHTIDEFYSYIIQSENRKGSLFNIDNNEKYINVPLLYKFTQTKNITNVIILNEKKLEELSKFFNIRISTGDTSDYDMINFLKDQLKEYNINGWINQDDQCQILLFNPVNILSKNGKIKEKEIYQIFDDELKRGKLSKLKILENKILENKLKLSKTTTFKKTRSNICLNDYIEFSDELKTYISNSLSKEFEYLKNDLFKYDTNANYINMRIDIENYIKNKLCDMDKKNSIEFIKSCHDSIEKFVHICLANSLRPIIYKIILDIQEKLNGCAKIVVGGRETSNLSVKPEERVISTDIDSKIFLNFYFPNENEQDESKKETLYYIFKQKFVNKMFYKIMPEIIELYNKYYSEHIYKILNKLENTFEMKILDIKFPRPNEPWLKKRFTILESDLDKLGAEDHIELFVLDMIIPQMYLPFANPNTITEKFSFVSTTYGMLDMPISGKKGLPYDFKKYITNKMNFYFGKTNSKSAIRLQNDNFKLANIDEFEKLYFLNKNYEIYDKERLLDIKNRTEDKLEKDKKTLLKLKNTKCKTNNKTAHDLLYDYDCIKNNSNKLMINIDKQYNLTEYLNVKNKYIKECGCDLESLNIDYLIKEYNSKINNKNTYLSLGIMKCMRYLAPLSLYNSNNYKNVFDDRTELLNKIFDYDEFKKSKTKDFKNLNSSFWKKFNLTDQEKRIKSLKYIELSNSEKGDFKNKFLDLLTEYTTSVLSSSNTIYQIVKKNSIEYDKIYSNPNKYIGLIKNKLGKLLYGYPLKEDSKLLSETNTGKGIDNEMLMYLSFQDIILLIWKYWCCVLDKQSFLYPETRFTNCLNITNNLLNIGYIDYNLEKLLNKENIKIIEFDIPNFEKLLKSINENNIVLSQYKNDKEIQEKLTEEDELNELFDKMDIDFELSNIDVNMDI